jgi:hypothetical protein
MPDSARSGSLHDSAATNVEQDGDNERADQNDAATNVEQDGDNERADQNDANEKRGADAGNEEHSDEHEADAPPPKSVDLTAAKSEVELLTLCHLRPDLARNEAAGSADARTLHAMSAVQNNFTELVRAAQLSDPGCIELHQNFQNYCL